MLLNEFTALGRIPIISQSMAYLPGYNVRVLLVIQAASQLREVYGPYASETMIKSAAARVVFAPKDFADAKEISDQLGFQTVNVRSHSRPRGLAFQRREGRAGNVTVSQHQRALLLPQEVKEIGPTAALIFCEGLRPIRCQKIRYYADKRFRKRLLPPPAHATLRKRAARAGSPTFTSRESPMPEAAAVADPESGSGIIVALDHLATLEDIDRLDSLTQEDFGERLTNLKFEHAGERPTDSELDADVERFLEAIR
jgi:type IV secretion system protein VirD4